MMGPLFVVSGTNDEEMERSQKATKQQVAFYASTPAYRPVLELHGWGELQPELTSMSKQGKWEEMGDLITDDILDAFAVQGSPVEATRALKDRFGDVVDRVMFYTPYTSDPQMWQEAMEVLRS